MKVSVKVDVKEGKEGEEGDQNVPGWLRLENSPTRPFQQDM